MPDGLLGILKLCLLALLYLFFIRVLWAIGRQLRAPEPSADLTLLNVPAPRPTRGKAPTRRERRGKRELVVVSGVRKDERFVVVEEMTIGRASGCHINIDDTFISQLHARLFHRDGQLMVEDLGSTNGTAVNNTPVTNPMPLNKGDRLRVGDTTMELR